MTTAPAHSPDFSSDVAALTSLQTFGVEDFATTLPSEKSRKRPVCVRSATRISVAFAPGAEGALFAPGPNISTRMACHTPGSSQRQRTSPTGSTSMCAPGGSALKKTVSPSPMTRSSCASPGLPRTIPSESETRMPSSGLEALAGAHASPRNRETSSSRSKRPSSKKVISATLTTALDMEYCRKSVSASIFPPRSRSLKPW